MRRLSRRAILIFATYASILLATVIAGYLGQAIGIWASILWGTIFITALSLYARRRLKPPQPRR